MGKNRKWFGAVKRVFSPDSKKKRSQKKQDLDPNCDPPPVVHFTPPEVPAVPVAEKEALIESGNGYEDQDNPSTEIGTAAVAVPPPPPPVVVVPEVVVRPVAARFAGKSKEEVAAIRIQSAFRGYLARRALRALKGLVRLKSLMHGSSVKRQSASTLRCMQTLSRVQSQIRSRRISMTEENQALQRQLQLKREKELEALKASMGEDWDDSLQSREQIEASLLSKHEASIKRERALAYAYSHQWKSSRSVNPMFMDPNNPNWGWSWVERWMASRPWETRSLPTKEPASDTASVKSAGGEILKAYSLRDAPPEKVPHAEHKTNHPASRQSPATPTSKVAPLSSRYIPPSPRSPRVLPEDDTRSVTSIRSERINRRHSTGTTIRDDESLASLPAVPSYMTATESAKAKSRFQSPSGDIPEAPPVASSPGPAKKRLSFPAAEKLGIPSPARGRRLSGPARVNATATTVGNGEGS